ncbi:MAG: YncE family protein [Saprospiraceae bacterium]|nr:YncE family protein [Saprospiraceae bacterium]
MRPLMLFCIGIVLLTLPLIGTSQTIANEDDVYSQSIIHEGIQVTFSLNHIDKSKDPKIFTQDDDVLFRFEITDTLSKKAVTGAAPAAWMEPMVDAEDQNAECGQKISAFLSGTLFKRAELDLNIFYVLVMNDDASISVVDPLFSFGGSQLLAYVQLDGTPEDWVVSKDQLNVYVSMPKSEKIAVVNTSNWEVEKNIELNAIVNNVCLQPDEAYLWADFDSRRIENYSGVAAISTENNEVKASISTGKGEHQIVISDDNTYVFVSNNIDQTVSIIDIASLKKVKDIPIGGPITSMAWSSMADVLYVIDKDSGNITGIDGKSLEVVSIVQGKTGISSIKFDPSGRFGFILGKEESIVQILDAASNRIVQNGTTEEKPIEVSFSDELAYVLHEESETILMFPLEVIGLEGQRLQAADFPGGQYPPGKIDNPSKGELMVQAPGANAMLISNNLDKTIYYYMEGMAAPMGNFSNYNKTPRAVEVIDRSLEERRPGVYETVAKIRGYGNYDIPFFVDVPRLLHCFSVGVKPNEESIKEQLKAELGSIAVHHVKEEQVVKSGDSYNMMFVLFDPIKNEPITGLQDVRIRGTSSGNWFHEGQATESGVPGVYKYNLKFDESGVYYLYVECLSKDLPFNNPQYLLVKVI